VLQFAYSTNILHGSTACSTIVQVAEDMFTDWHDT
jgi:hypothetical protein